MIATPVLPACAFGNLFYFWFFQQPGVIIDIGEHYPKQTWRNRYDIAAANGLLSLTIPVIGLKGKKVPVKNIEIDHSENWALQHMKTLTSAYQSAPFFEYYSNDLKTLLEQAPKDLASFNIASVQLVMKWLQLDTQLEISENYIPPESASMDLRPVMKPSKFPSDIIEIPPYFQVFSDKHPFHNNCSALDLVFNLGPEARSHLGRIRVKESQIANLDR